MKATDITKKYIIENFLNQGYRFATVMLKNMVIADIIKHSWFPTTYNDMTDTFIFDLGLDNACEIKCIWEQISRNNSVVWHVKNFE